jgi:hypothetical protein
MTTRTYHGIHDQFLESRVSGGESMEGISGAVRSEGALSALQWSAPRTDRPGVVWPVDAPFPVNGHAIDMPGSPRVIIRGEMVQ